MFGFSLFIIVLTYHLLKGRVDDVLAIGIIIITTFSILTYARNNVWRTNVSMWEDVTRKSPNDKWSHSNLGISYINEGKYDKALKSLQRSVEIDPNFTDGYANAGILYGTIGDNETAIKYFQTALKIHPEYPKALINMGVALTKLQRYEEAIPYLEKAIEVQPYNTLARNKLEFVHSTLNSQK